MAKRGRPSKKTLKKRAESKQKAELMLLVAALIVTVLVVVGYLVLM